MAVFLSMAALAYLTQPEMQVGELGSFFVRQMSVGIIFGMALGRIAVHILQNRTCLIPDFIPSTASVSSF